MSADLEQLVTRWEEQQSAYITHREQRFDVMLDVIGELTRTDDRFQPNGEGLIVVDMACGTGSLSARILRRFPSARVIGMDYDPVLLAVASESLAPHGDRFQEIDGDLAGAGWAELLPVQEVHAAVSSTALHWLTPAQLVAVYMRLSGLLVNGGLFLNADHLRYAPATQPFLSRIAAEDDARTQRGAHERGVQTWEQWWAGAISIPRFAAKAVERELRFADRPPTPHAPLGLHLDALAAAGFSEQGTIWQYLDDYVVLARR